jgi:hypothetical protein
MIGRGGGDRVRHETGAPEMLKEAIQSVPVVLTGGESYLKVPGAIRPTWPRVVLSLVPAFLLGWIVGPVLYGFSQCGWSAETNCPAYSPTGIVLSYLLSWPIFLSGSLLLKFGVYIHTGSLNPVAPEFVLLWVYYYFLVSIADSLSLRRRKKPSARATVIQ